MPFWLRPRATEVTPRPATYSAKIRSTVGAMKMKANTRRLVSPEGAYGRSAF
jgi:hypothetical protein